MKLSKKETGEDLELDMSPMIDMVFLLLIFFIVASQVIDEKPKVDIPPAAFAKIPEDTTGRLMISVSKEGQYFIASDLAPKTIEEVTERIQMEIDADPELRILIRADAKTRYKDNEKISIACAEIGAQDLIYSAFEE